jgi:hypothetical protein
VFTVICKELHSENFKEVIWKVKDLKDKVKKSKKEKKLITNL